MRTVTWTLESGSNVLCSGGMSKNSKDDRVSKKNNYIQQTLYDHPNLAERTCLQLTFSFRGDPEGFFMPAISAGFHTHSRPGVLSDINSLRTRLFPEMAKPHARLTRARTRCSTRQNNQAIAAELWES